MNFLKWFFAGNEMRELENWRRTTDTYLRGLSDNPHVHLVLSNLRAEIKNLSAPVDPGFGRGYYTLDSLADQLLLVNGPSEIRVIELEGTLKALIDLRTLKMELEASREANENQDWWQANIQKYLAQRESLWDRALKVLNKK